jgi:hypothetical protein
MKYEHLKEECLTSLGHSSLSPDVIAPIFIIYFKGLTGRGVKIGGTRNCHL